MSPSPIVTVGDLSEWLGEPIESGADEKRATWAIRAASALVRAEARRTWADEEVPEIAMTVTLAASARAYTNPRGIEDKSEGIDDYNDRERLRVEESGVYLTKSERQQLAGYSRARYGIGTINTTRGDLGYEDPPSWIINGPDPNNPWDEA